MRIFDGKEYSFRVRTPVRGKHISNEYLKLADALKNLVDTEGQEVYCDVDKLKKVCSSKIVLDHIEMIITIAPYVRIFLSEARAIDEETITEQMYCALLQNGFSRNVIVGLLYAVFFSLNRTLKLSAIERKKLYEADTFAVYQSDSIKKVDDNNIDIVKALIEQGDNNAKVEPGSAILNKEIKKNKDLDNPNEILCEEYAKQLLEEGLNHGSGKAAQVLGNDNLLLAKKKLFSNNYYSKAYEYYTIYGAMPNNNLRESQSRIIDILNLGQFHHKMMFNYIVTAILFSLSYFILFLLGLSNIGITLATSAKSCIILSLFEMMTVVIGVVVRYAKPFFTQGWIVFLQFLIWFVAMIAMIP